MAMTAAQREEILNTLGLGPEADESRIKKVYRQEILKCHPDLIKHPEGATDAQKKQSLKESQDRFIKIQTAYDLLTGRIMPSEEEDLLAAPVLSQHVFWTKPLSMDFDLYPEMLAVFNELFFKNDWAEHLPHLYQMGYEVTLSGQTVKLAVRTFSSREQLGNICAGLSKVAGKVKFDPVNFPRPWLDTVYDALSKNPNVTHVQFPDNYQVDSRQSLKWLAFNKPRQAESSFSKQVREVFNKNQTPMIGSAVTAVILMVATGGFFLPLAVGIGAFFAGREGEKRVKAFLQKNKAQYNEGQIAGHPEEEAYHLGESVTGFYPLVEALKNPQTYRTAYQAPGAVLAGLQHAWETPEDPKRSVIRNK